MDNIQITYETLAFIVAIGGVWSFVMKLTSPYKKLKEDVKNKAEQKEFEMLKEEFEKLKLYQNTDHDRLKDLERGNEEICKCILALTDHELTGNSIDKLRKAKDEMQKYLIERK